MKNSDFLQYLSNLENMATCCCLSSVNCLNVTWHTDFKSAGCRTKPYFAKQWSQSAQHFANVINRLNVHYTGLSFETSEVRKQGRRNSTKSVQNWGQCKLIKNKQFVTSCSCFCSAMMFTSGAIPEIIENYSDLYGCADSCNKFASIRSG